MFKLEGMIKIQINFNHKKIKPALTAGFISQFTA